MNCQDFESTIVDFVRCCIFDAQVRESALVHAKSCARCAKRFADEQELTSSLRALVAASPEREELPTSAEISLRSAFREQHGAHASLAPAMFTPVDAGWARRRMAWAATGMAIAAALILAIIVPYVQRTQTPSQVEDLTRQEVREMLLPRPGADGNNIGSFATSPVATLSDEGEQIVRRPQFGRTPSERRVVEAGNSRASNLASSNLSASGNADDEEIGTEFLPLMHESNLTSFEGGQVVRVELPRRALVSVGLPMNLERAGERVKADVLLGEDGVARAIRFVR